MAGGKIMPRITCRRDEDTVLRKKLNYLLTVQVFSFTKDSVSCQLHHRLL